MSGAAALHSALLDGVLLLTISNRARRNALHPDMYRAGLAAIERAARDDAVGAVILTGDGEHFCAGGDLARLRDNRLLEPAVQAASIAHFHAWILAIRRCPKPVIAAVEGHAAGAGCSLALACDLLVCAEQARLSMGYAKVGLSPDGGGSAFLAALVPRQLALEMLLLGQPVDAARLHTLGVANRLAPPGQALAQARALAVTLARGPREAQRRIKQLLGAASDPAGQSLAAQLRLESEQFIDGLFGAEAAEGIAAFLERRPARFLSPM